MARLAAPVALAELGWMAMTTVDTIMIGGLGPAAIGAIGVGSSVYYSIAIFGMGLLLGLDTLVSQAHGAGDKADTHHSLGARRVLGHLHRHSAHRFVPFHGPDFLWLGINPEVSRLAAPFVTTLALGTLPLLLYGAFRRYLQGIGHVRPVMSVLISANLINWLFNWLLIYGHWGCRNSASSARRSPLVLRASTWPALCSFAFGGSNAAMNKASAAFCALQIPRRLFRLMGLGLPAATQILLEIGAFGAPPSSPDAYPPGYGRAQHRLELRRRHYIWCRSASPQPPPSPSARLLAEVIWLALAVWVISPSALGCTFMACSAAFFLSIPQRILSIYTTDAGVLATGVSLLAIAAVFPTFRRPANRCYRRLTRGGNTRIAMLVNFAGYWLFGLPVGYCFAFTATMESLVYGGALPLR